jgi:hypothetical protein
MTASTLVDIGPTPLLARRLRVEVMFFWLCLAFITAGFFGYWVLLKFKIFYLAWTACFCLTVWLSLFGRLRLADAARDSLPLLVWLAYLLASTLWSPSPATAFWYFTGSLLYPLVFILSFVWARSIPRPTLAVFFELNLLVIFPLLMWYLVTNGKLPADHPIPIRSEFAQRIVTGIPFLVWQLRNRPRLGRKLLLVASLVASVVIESRAVILIAPIVLFASWVFIQRRAGRLRAATQAMALIAVAIGLAVALPPVRGLMERGLSRFGPQTMRLSISSAMDELSRPPEERADIERRVSLAVAMQSFLAHPFRGGGYYSTMTITGDLLPRAISAHGLPSTLLGETGLIGTMIFAWIIVRFFRRLARARAGAISESEHGFLQACTITMLAALLLGLLQQVDQTIWLYVLLAWGYAASRRGFFPTGSTALSDQHSGAT